MSSIVRKNITVQNDSIAMTNLGEGGGTASIWLAAGSAGDVILEYGMPNASDVLEWLTIKIKNPAIAVNAEADKLTGAAGSQFGYAITAGATNIRARRTDNAGGACFVTLMFKRT